MDLPTLYKTAANLFALAVIVATAGTATVEAANRPAAPQPIPSPGWNTPRVSLVVAYEEIIDYYTVKGRTFDAVRRSLRERGPRATGMARAIGSHTPHFNFSYKKQVTDEGCRVGQTLFKLRSNLKIPKWQPGGKARRGVGTAMRRYQASVLKHERTHARIALTFMERVQAKVVALPFMENCSKLRQAVDRIIANEHIRERREQQAFHRSERNICLPLGRCRQARGRYRRLSVDQRGKRARIDACRRKLGMSRGYGVVRLSDAEFERRCGR
ncbi:MAG: DUF922 domain-containing Zn-dependent protease [Alphaproteobacteria bacterium]|nr:DUF922 domain-containing Zn-dependent protease [Alphaproteobacteria bacterium]